MTIEIRLPKPAYVRSRMVRRKEPDAALYSVLVHLGKMYRLGEIVRCYRAKPSNSLNFVVITTQGKYIFRRHLLSEETVAHEYEMLNYLRQQNFPAPRMLQDQEGRAWVNVEGEIYSIYAFVEGYRPIDFWWCPSHRRAILRQTGRTLAELHHAVVGLEPTHFKWDAYCPRTSCLQAEHPLEISERKEESADRSSVDLAGVCGPRRARWRDGALYRQALTEIRVLVNKASATSPIDNFARSRIGDLERLIELEHTVEERPGLCKVVIHGDYAPWNILRRPDRSLFVLDFNAARLDLRMYDIMLATFWFAWRQDHLDMDTAVALQTGYFNGCRQPSSGLTAGCSVSGGILEPSEVEIAMAHHIFRWLMGRSIVERLRSHYLEGRFLLTDPRNLERFHQMCVWAGQQPEQLTLGLRRAQNNLKPDALPGAASNLGAPGTAVSEEKE